MKTWERVQTGCLIATLGSSILVLAKLLVSPLKQPVQPSYIFPATVPLAGWNFVQSNSLDAQKLRGPALVTSVEDQSIASRDYRYSRNGQPLRIQMRYFVDSYIGVPEIIEESDLRLRQYKPNFTRHESSIGSYALFRRSGQLHLSACLTASGRSTVTQGELRGNQNRIEVLANRAIPWVLGRAPLRDLRCLWTQVSVPIDVTSSQTQERELIEAWTQWAQWWHQNYPSEPL